jgi:hypothetical protein
MDRVSFGPAATLIDPRLSNVFSALVPAAGSGPPADNSDVDLGRQAEDPIGTSLIVRAVLSAHAAAQVSHVTARPSRAARLIVSSRWMARCRVAVPLHRGSSPAARSPRGSSRSATGIESVGNPGAKLYKRSVHPSLYGGDWLPEQSG